MRKTFYGWRVVNAAFVLAVLGLGFGFYGPPVFLHAVRDARGWSLPLVSTAVTVHFLIGSIVTANLPALYQRFGVPMVTKAGALLLAVGVFGWATADVPWQLFAATLLSGAGWVTMGIAAVNAIVSPWFARDRPAALAAAYNGANVGGIIFSPLWVAAIDVLGFPIAAAAIGLVMVLVMWVLADHVFARTPNQVGLNPDGDGPGAPVSSVSSPTAKPLPGSLLWRNRKFIALSAGMSLGLFAQIGLTAHLFSLLLPALGAQQAGLAMGAVTVMAIVGRTLVGSSMPVSADRWLIASASYAVQIVGSIAFIIAAGTNIPVLLLGVLLFGLGFGNGTFLPPLIAQMEFVPEDVPRVVALIVAIAQGAYSFAPATFGVIREFAPSAPNLVPAAAPSLYLAVALLQGLAICALLAGRHQSARQSSEG